MQLTSKIAAVALTVPLGVALAGPASASAPPDVRGTITAKTGAWTPWTNIPVAKPRHYTACGGHRVEIRDYIQHEKARTRKISTRYGPATEIEVYGRYVARVVDLTAKTSATVNASGSSLGPNSQIAYQDGAYLYRATGASIAVNSRVEIQSSGLPRIAVTQGRIGVLFGTHSGGDEAQVITKPDTVVDGCTLL